jgi:hypothetical protein
MTPCRLCKAPAVGVLMEAAIVEPWHDGERSPAVDLNVRRVLARGDALCGVCERGVGYFPTTAPDDPEAYTAWWETA